MAYGVAAALGVMLLPLAATAQRVAGVGEDAIPIPRGGYRFLVAGLWNDWRAVYTPGGPENRRGVLAGLATENLGVAQLSQLRGAQASMRALSGNNGFAISLGALEATGEVRQSIAPISVDYGVTRRLSLRVLVPYVESRDVSQLVLNRTGRGANVGQNPVFSTTGATARSTNGALLTQIERANAALAAEITRCGSATAMGCDAIRANPAAAQALIARAQQTRADLVTVYGDATRGGAPVVPITGSTLHTAVVSTIATLRRDFGAYGISNIAESAQPAGASLVYGPAGINNIASDSAFGVGYDRLGNTRRAGIGDVDLTATLLVFDTFKADQLRRLLSPARGVRSSMTVGWRFGTAGADRTEDAFDVPIGEGANALLLRSTTDLLINRWAWVSATVRAAQPLGDRVAVAVPFRDEAAAFSQRVSVSEAARTLGTRLDLELAPRFAVGEFFGVSAAYLMRHWSADRYEADAAGSEPAPGQRFDVPSRTMNAAAIGVTFSTLMSYARGRSRFPAEVIYTHTVPLGASGGVVPVMSSDRLELRVYTGFPRR